MEDAMTERFERVEERSDRRRGSDGLAGGEGVVGVRGASREDAAWARGAEGGGGSEHRRPCDMRTDSSAGAETGKTKRMEKKKECKKEKKRKKVHS